MKLWISESDKNKETSTRQELRDISVTLPRLELNNIWTLALGAFHNSAGT